MLRGVGACPGPPYYKHWNKSSFKTGFYFWMVPSGLDRWSHLDGEIPMDEHEIDLQELCERFNTDGEGLTTAQAIKTLATTGPNELTPPPRRPWLLALFLKTLNAGTLAGAIVTAVIARKVLARSRGEDVAELYISIALWLPFALGCAQTLFESHGDRGNTHLEFRKMSPPRVNVMRDGKRIMVASAELVVGDIINLRCGDQVPADVRVLDCCVDCCVDNASLTGESEPQKRRPELTANDPLETANLAFFGTTISDGEMSGMVVRVGDATMMGRIAAQLTKNSGDDASPLEKSLRRGALALGCVANALGAASFARGWLVDGTGWEHNAIVALALVHAIAPDRVRTCLQLGSVVAARKLFAARVMVKNLRGIEALGAVTCVCTDMTGTLTQNSMTVARLVHAGEDGRSAIHKAGSTFDGGVKTFDAHSAAFQALCACATLNNTCFFDKRCHAEMSMPTPPFREFVEQEGSDVPLEKINWEPRGKTSEAALIKFTQPLMEPLFGCEDIDEYRARNAMLFTIPFNSKKKYQARTAHARHVARVCSAPPSVAQLNGSSSRACTRPHRCTCTRMPHAAARRPCA